MSVSCRNVPDTSSSGLATIEQQKSDLLDFYVNVSSADERFDFTCIALFHVGVPDSLSFSPTGNWPTPVLRLLGLRRLHAYLWSALRATPLRMFCLITHSAIDQTRHTWRYDVGGYVSLSFPLLDVGHKLNIANAGLGQWGTRSVSTVFVLVLVFLTTSTFTGSDLWIWMSFLRTGRADIFRMAYALTRHLSEVDFHHIGPFAGLGSRHHGTLLIKLCS